jgi:protein-arginine kinase activator protein McsA
MTEGKARRHTGNCYDCSGPLELYEIDMQKSTKIMVCRNCGLFHYYKKDFIGNYKLINATKNPDIEKRVQQPLDK